MDTDYPKKVKIIEVGPRDGLQNEAKKLSTKDKFEFIKLLSESGLKNIEIGAFVNPKAVPQMEGSLELIKEIESKLKNDIEYSALVPNQKGYETALESGIKRIAVFTAASETFNQKNTNKGIEESLETFKPIIKDALSKHLTVRGYISTCFFCPYEGKVEPTKVLEVIKKLNFMGVDEISIGDTTGAAGPYEVFKLLELIVTEIPKEKIALHFHDTYGTALTNVFAALSMGITTFDSSAGGLGGCPYAPGASGNLATEDLVYLLNRMGIESGVDLNKLAIASSFIQNKLEKKLPSKNLQRILSQS